MQENLELVFRLVELFSIVAGGGAILVKMGRMAGKFEEIGSQQAVEIREMKSSIQTLNQLITAVAVQKVEMEAIRSDVGRLTDWYDELRRGLGWIRPGPERPTT